MGLLAYQPIDATITVTKAGSGANTCAIQLLGANGEDLAVPAMVNFYLSSDSEGLVKAIDGTDTSEIAIATDGLLFEDDTDISGRLVSEADGDIGLLVTVISGKSAYLCVVTPDGRLVISDELTYAA